MINEDSSIENIPVQFVGILPSISANLDITYRSLVLTEIEKGKVALKIAFGQNYESNALVFIDDRSLKVLSNNSKKEMFIKIPIHHIGAVSYLFEDNIHILVIKYGDIDKNYKTNDNLNSCFLAILFCESKAIAEKICYCVESCFRIIYSPNRNYSDMNTNINQFRNNNEPLSSQISMSYAFRSSSFANLQHLDNSPDSIGAPYIGSFTRQISNESHMVMPAAREAQIDNVAQQLIANYMEKLSEIFSKEEFETFCGIMKSWHSTEFDFETFCEKLIALFGRHRYYLLKDISPFIPAKDLPSFQSFINKLDNL